MTPKEAKRYYGATHFMPMRDGVTPQTFYKQVTELYNDGVYRTRWVFLTFANLWFGSFATADELATLKEIT